MHTNPRSGRELQLVARPEADVASVHFHVAEVLLPEPDQGEVVVQGLYLSIEPLLRGRILARSSYARGVEPGERMVGRALSRVVESRHDGFSPGDVVEHWLGWRDWGVVPGADLRRVEPGPWPLTAHLGALGASGLSGYLALTRLGRPVAGETVVVTSAAGAVGSLVVQMARLKGCRVVGVAGGPEKCAYVRDVLGADAVVDYRAAHDLSAAVAEAAPEGVHVFFDAVGGLLHDAVVDHLAPHGRVIVFGTMDFYSNPTREGGEAGRQRLRDILVKRATISGFLVHDHADGFDAARTQLQDWWRQGLLKSEDVVREGLEAAPQALCDVIAGHVRGKMLVRLAE